MPEMKSSIMSMASKMSRSARLESLEGKDCFLLCATPYRLLQHAPVRQIDTRFQDFAEAHFQPGHIEQGEASRTVEIAHQIDVRLRTSLPAGDGTEQGQSYDTGSFKLGLILAKFGYDRRLVNPATLCYIPPSLNSLMSFAIPFQVFKRVVEINFSSLEDAVHRIPADAEHFSRLSRRHHTVTHGFNGGCFEHGARKIRLLLGQTPGDFVRQFHGDLHRATSLRIAKSIGEERWSVVPERFSGTTRRSTIPPFGQRAVFDSPPRKTTTRSNSVYQDKLLPGLKENEIIWSVTLC